MEFLFGFGLGYLFVMSSCKLEPRPSIGHIEAPSGERPPDPPSMKQPIKEERDDNE